MGTNASLPFDLELVLQESRVDRSAAETRAAELGTRRSLKKEAQVAADLNIIQVLDLTTLQGDDTYGNVDRLCAKGLTPVEASTLHALGLDDLQITVGAVCVYSALVPVAVAALHGHLPVASVATGFPSGQISLAAKLQEIKDAIAAGAKEIDVVVSRALVLQHEWRKLYDEIVEFRNACGSDVKLKVILATGQLGNLENVTKAAMVAMLAGADTIKTSTGMEAVNATIPVSLVMVRMIRRFLELTGIKVGHKPAGGIGEAKDARLFYILMLEELGEEWTRPDLFRIGASRLLNDLEGQLYHNAFGRYGAPHHRPSA